MQKRLNIIFKYTLKLVLLLCLVLGTPVSKSLAAEQKIKDKKAIILIMDQISLQEMLDSHTPNIDMLMDNGSIGLMNSRAKSSLTNRGSAYLSLGMGVRTLASTRGGLAFEENTKYPLSDSNLATEYANAKELYTLYTGENPPNGEIINIAIGDIRRTALDITPNNEVGLLGKVAKENGLIIGALGNSDSGNISREVSMLAMDENGVVPLGAIDSDLLTVDANVLGGIRLNQEILLKEVERILPDVDILFIDYGDTVRVEESNRLTTDVVRRQQKIQAIERADLFLGKVINKVDLEKTLFLCITPNPSREMINNGNFALTPILISSNNTVKGLLTSSTTRREGLVTNFDFGPTIFDFFGVSKSNAFIGEPIKAISNENPRKVLLRNQEESLFLRKYRSIFHWAFIILVGISLFGFYLPRFIKWKRPSSKLWSYIGLSVLAIPLTMMTVSLFGYKSIIFDLSYVILGAFIIVYVLKNIFKEKIITMTILGFSTSILILIDIFFLQKLMIISPLGSDAIAGGRFYGVGNDYMGILIGSTLIAIFSLCHIYKIKKSTSALFATFYMILIIIGLSPFFGANVGGTLSAVLTTLVLLLIVFDKKLSFKRIVIIIIGVISVGIILGLLDTLFNTNPTHAGKAVQALLSGGLGKFFEIIGSKLKQVVWNLVHASWNIILFTQIILTILLYKFKNKLLIKIRENYPNLSKGFMVTLLGGIVIFAFNDTGTIGAALSLIYLFIPLGILINKEYS